MIHALRQIAATISENDIPNVPKNTLTTGSGGTINSVLQLVFAIAGAIALLVITVAAFQYVVSQGDPQSTNKAKNTILYALIGLVICIMAFTIVTFVIDRI